MDAPWTFADRNHLARAKWNIEGGIALGKLSESELSLQFWRSVDHLAHPRIFVKARTSTFVACIVDLDECCKNPLRCKLEMFMGGVNREFGLGLH